MVPESPLNQGEQNTLPAADTWVATYGDTLLAYARLRVRDQATAEELVQETLLAALQGARYFSGQANFGTWLTGILKHKIVDHFRRRQPETPLDLENDFVVDAMFNKVEHWKASSTPRPWRQSPDAVAEQVETQRALQRCLESLPERYRQAFVMRVMDESDTNEVCKILGLTPNHLYVLLHRARLRLRACLEDQGIGA